MKKAIPEIDPEKCIGWGDCVDECPTGAVEMVEGKAAAVSPEQCIYCTTCESVCLYQAIRCPFEIILAAKRTNRAKERPNKTF